MSPIVVYQGEPGAYSEQATHELLGDNVKAIGLESFEKCFLALDKGSCDFAMMPIENSMGGSVHDCFDLQVKFDFNIVAELDFRVRHCLMALPGLTRDKIEVVISHYQALAQCEQYFQRHGLKYEKDYDTAGSAKKIFEMNLTTHAAVASKLAAKVHNLNIIDEGIEDDPNNVTRFFLLSKRSLIPPTNIQLLKESNIEYKTTIVLSFENIPGALCRALSFFASQGIDLVKLESRPNKLNKKGRILPGTLSDDILELFSQGRVEILEDTSGDKARYPFIFYLDVLGSIAEFKLLSALRKISAFCVFFRVLGSYPRFGVLQQFVANSVGIKNNTTVSKDLPKANEGIFAQKDPVDVLKIAIIGFGNFGQFLAKTFVNHHTVVACNLTDERFAALKIGVEYYENPTDLLENEPDIDVVLFSTAILAFDEVLQSISPTLLKGRLLVDVLSVKSFPKQKLLDFIENIDNDASTGVLSTHPMFGPESGKFTWKNLPMVYEKVFVQSEAIEGKVRSFLKIFEDEGCCMVDMNCEEHDRQAADSQFITHFLGRTIERLNLKRPADKSREISTQGFKSLLTIRDQTIKDSFNLFSALYGYNKNSKETIRKLREAMNSVQSELDSLDTQEKEDELYIPSSTVTNIAGSQTGAIFALATKLRNMGKDIVMSLCVGEPDFQPPKAILEATKIAVDEGFTKYTTNKGVLELREAITTDLRRRKKLEYSAQEEILVTASGKQALYLVLEALLEEGNEVIVPSPYWTSYPEMVKFGGGKPVIVERKIEHNFILQAQALESAINKNTKMLILCNPCNPTGCLYTEEDLSILVDVLSKPKHKHILILADEIYERLIYDDLNCKSIASFENMKERTIIVNGFSKAFAMTGYRLGYIAGNKDLISWCTKLQSQLNSCACSISQKAGIAALSKVTDEELLPLYEELQKKRDLIVSLLNDIPKIKLADAKGAFYVLPDVSSYIGCRNKEGQSISSSTALCTYLIENHGVALVPGEAFGAGATVRFSFATSFQDIQEAVVRFRTGLLSLD